MLKTVIIQGRTFEADFIQLQPDSNFVIKAQLSASVDVDLQQPIKQYDNGIKLLLIPTSQITDTGAEKWSLFTKRTSVNPNIFYRDVDTQFEEIL